MTTAPNAIESTNAPAGQPARARDVRSQLLTYVGEWVARSPDNEWARTYQRSLRASVAQLSDADLWHDLAALHYMHGHRTDAQTCVRHALALGPAAPIRSHMLLSQCLLSDGDRGGGCASLRRAAALMTSNPAETYIRGVARLLLGDVSRGLADVEARAHSPNYLTENGRVGGAMSGARRWNGKRIRDAVLAVHLEHGAGDQIMNSRFLDGAKDRSRARSMLLADVAPQLDALLRCAADDVVAGAVPRVRPDYYVPSAALMRCVGCHSYAQMPHRAGWLKPPRGHEVPLGARAPGTLRVGIVWAGRPEHLNDRYRSIPWRVWCEALLNDKELAGGISWVSLQVGTRGSDPAVDPPRSPLFDVTPQLTSYAATAHVCAQLDLVISVDTSVVHLAGALVDGPPVWMLTPAAPDWRWGLHGETTPWYSRVRLVRQDRADDWGTPLQRVARELAAFVSLRCSSQSPA